MATYDELMDSARRAQSEGRAEDAAALVDQAVALRKAADAPAAAPSAEEEGAIESVGRGIVTAPISLAQGVAELGALGLDAAFDTNTLRPTTDFFEGVKESIAPERSAGKIAEEVVAFGVGFIPIAGWLGRASQAARAGQTLGGTSRFFRSAEKFGASRAGQKLLKTRAGLYGTTAAATGLYEGIFSPSGRETLSDQFEFFPDALKTEEYAGEIGRTEAGRQLRNRLRQVAEASALSAGFDTLLYGMGAGARQAAQLPVLNEAIGATARGITSSLDLMGRGLSQVPGANRANELFQRYFTPTKGADPAVVRSINDAVNFTSGQKRQAIRLITGYDNEMKKALRELKKTNATALALGEAEKDIYGYMTGGVDADTIQQKYGPAVKKHVDAMVSQAMGLEDLLVRQLEDVASVEEFRARQGVAMLPGVPGVAVTKRGEAARAAVTEIQRLQKMRRAHLSRMFQVHQNPLEFYRELGDDFMESTSFQDAVRGIMAYNTRGNPGNYGNPEAIENAQRMMLDIVGLSEISAGVAPQKAIQDRIQKILRQAGDKGGLLAERRPIFQLSNEMLIPQKEIISKVPAVRAFMGEIQDPKALAIHTINRLAETTTAFDFYRNVLGRNAQTVGDALPKIREGARPLVVELPNPQTMGVDQYNQELEKLQLAGIDTSDFNRTIENLEDTLQQNGYRKLGEKDFDSALGGRFGDLSGTYVPEEVYANLTAPMQLTSHPASQLASIVNQIKGLSQKMLIVPNIASRVRDFLGGHLMRIASGNAPSLYNRDNFQAAQLFLRSGAQLDNEGLARLQAKLDAAGVVDSNILMNAIREYQAEGPSIGAAQRTRGIIEKYESVPGFKQVMDFFEGITDGVDGYMKATVMLGEEAKLKEIIKGADLQSQQEADSFFDWLQRQGVVQRTRSEVLNTGVSTPVPGGKPRLAPAERAGLELSSAEVIAADLTRQFMPTYDQIGSFIRATDRALPFGNFTSFAAENIRNVSNIFEHGLREMAARPDAELIAAVGEQRARALTRLTRAAGAQRLMGLLTVAAIAPKAMVRASMNATGTTEAQMERLYEQVPDYLAGHDLIVLSNDGKGKIEYVDLSYVSPYGYVTDAIQAALRNYSEKGRLDANEAEQIASAAWTGFAELLDPFAAESIVFERVRDALPSSGFPGVGRGGETSTGALIYRDTDTLGTKIANGFVHVADSLAPAYVKLALEGRRGDIEPGRLTRAMTETPGARGEDYNAYEELARQVTGFTPMELNLRRDFEFAGKAYAPRRSGVKTTVNALILRGDATLPEIREGWGTYLDALYREQSRLYNDIQGARELGLSDQEIRRNLIQKANLGTGEVNSIMSGRFFPGLVSSEIRKDVVSQLRQEGRARVVQQVPWAELNRMSVERRGEALSPELFRRRQEAPATVESVTAAPQTEGAATAAPVVAPVPTPAAPQPPQVSARTAPPPLELLGSDPFSQLANLAIAQRTSGQ